MDPSLFASAMEQMPSPSLVIRNGRIVGQKGDIARSGPIWSASKSLTALIFARLLQQGKISGYDVAVPNSNNPTNPTATFRQFMSMTSDYNLSPHNPGHHYAYNNGAVHFYGRHMHDTFYQGRTEVQMLQDAFVSTLGFQDSVSYKGYLSGWDGGWSMSTRDMARIAYLVLRNGKWNDQQVVPASFINDLYKNQIPSGAVPTTDTRDEFYNQPGATAALPGAYSFGFWLPQGIQTEAITMSGAYGTSVHISRSKDLIVLGVNTTPNDHGGPKISGATLDLFAASITGSSPTPTPTPTPTSGLARIAISADGNDHDCDDITATAMSLALLAKTGNASRLVYYGHSDHIWSTGLDGACNGGNREEEMRISSEETAKQWGGFNLGVFINARAQTSSAVSALASQFNASSASSPLWIIGAGPMEVIGRALEISDPSKRQFVTVVSHSEWNNNHAEEPGHGSWDFLELNSVLGAKIQSIVDQNAGLEVHESNYSWLQQSSDSRLNWIWQRHLKSGLSPEFDPSDSGMIYWLVTGANNG
ncbi:MAG TPA: serine hydrolase domain-containing protein, partial [Pyrinomonadaceae bacterium]|nr:serine hydrolase domain-containing protein [Pyrinomonadaceae bacterium]